MPRTLPGLEVDGSRVIISDHALQLDRVPASVVVLGGGVIGVEFASVWRSFGAEVTIVEALPHLVPLEDEASSKLLERAFRRRGIKQELGARFGGVEHTDGGVRVVAGERQDDRGRAAARRRRARPGLAGPRATRRPASPLDRGFVKVDEYCQTTVPTVSAVGDLIPPRSSRTSASARASWSPSRSPG